MALYVCMGGPPAVGVNARMAEVFDPYYIWLGIPPEEQPADYYRLLGIRRFESNGDVIANAADQRVRHLRSMQAGKRQAETQKLLNEIAAAAAVLLDLEKKRKYDDGLPLQHSRTARTPLPVTQPSAGVNQQIRPAGSPTIQASDPPTALRLSGPATSPRHPHWAGWLTIGGLSAAAVVLLVLVIALATRKDDEPNQEPLNGNLAQRPVSPDGTRPPAVPAATTPATPKPAPITTANISPSPQVNPPSQVTPPPSTTSPVPPVVVPMPPLVTPPPPAKSPPPVSTANLEHQKNWEYGYGRLNAAGNKVVEFYPLVFSAELHPDGTNTVRWGVGPHYPAAGPLDIMHLRKDGGHTANDPSIVVIRRWRHPAKCVIKASGELEVPERGGDGVQVRLVTGNGERIWRTKDRGQRVSMDVNEFVLEENEPLDLCVDCNINHSFDTFKMRLHLAARFPDGKKDEWDSITDYRDPLPAGPMPATVDVAKPARFPVPGEASLTAARGKLKETFGDLAQKSKKPEEKLKLYAELRRVADSEKDPAISFVLLDAARRLAMSGQDVRAALLVSGEIARQYETDPPDHQLQTLKLAVGATMPASAWEDAVGAAMALAESGRDMGQIEVAEAASLLAVEFAAKGKNLELRKQATQLREAVQVYRKSAALVKEAEATLTTNPDDPAANLVVGKWHCFVLDDWVKGLPCLEKCGEPALAAAAKAERDPKNTLAIADAWYLAAEKLPRNERKPMQMRAQKFYALAAKELKGLDQLRAAKREEDLKEAVGQAPSEKVRTASVPPQDEKLEPGLIVRIVSGSQAIPTPILGTSMNWDGIVWDNVEFESRKVLDLRSISASPLATGFIQLETDDTVVFTLRNAYCLIDGDKFPPILVNQKGQDLSYLGGRTEGRFEKQLTKGRHSLLIGRIPMNTGAGLEFKVKGSKGGECVFHSPADLETELARPILLPNGARTKGVLLFGNLRFSR